MTDRTITDCHDCGAKPGDLHNLGCDTERCPLCGGQFLQCFSQHRCPQCGTQWIEVECVTDGDGWPTVVTDADRLPWTGTWPGVEECREFGWYSYFVPYQGWYRCSPDHPGASEDLNRLHEGEATWSRERKRFVLREDA